MVGVPDQEDEVAGYVLGGGGVEAFHVFDQDFQLEKNAYFF